MKFLSKRTNCGNFYLCAGWMAAGHSYTHSNDGIVHQALYCQAGGGLINDEPSSPSKFTKWSPSRHVPVTYKSYDTSVTLFVAIAHKQEEDPFMLEPLPSGDYKNITCDTNECYIASLENNILIGDKNIEEFQFARVNKGQTVAVSIPEGSFGLVLTRA